jgi:carbamoyl-phosphate synthase large subunit
MPAPQEELRLMVLSIGSLAAQRFVDALGTRRQHCVLIGTNSLAEAASNFLCDSVHLVPLGSALDAYLGSLQSLIEREQPDIVIPTRDDDVLALAVLQERFTRATPVLLTGSVRAARMIQDKLETERFARRHGLPFVPTADDLERALELARTHGLPLVGKPRCGTASRGVVLLRSRQEIEGAFGTRSDLVVQVMLDPPSNIHELTAPFKAGLPFFFSFPETRQYFLQVVIGPDGASSPGFSTVSTQFFGQAIRTERYDDPELLELAQAYARAAASEGWRGPLNVQVKRGRDGKPFAHELNGRFSGGTAARAYLGFDEPAEVIKRFLPAKVFPSVSATDSSIVQNHMHTLPIPVEALTVLRARGSWAAAGIA